MNGRAMCELRVDQMDAAQNHVICVLVKPVGFKVDMGTRQIFRPFQMGVEIKQWPPELEKTENQIGTWQGLKGRQGRG